jgi:hypothetical protein
MRTLLFCKSRIKYYYKRELACVLVTFIILTFVFNILIFSESTRKTYALTETTDHPHVGFYDLDYDDVLIIEKLPFIEWVDIVNEIEPLIDDKFSSNIEGTTLRVRFALEKCTIQEINKLYFATIDELIKNGNITSINKYRDPSDFYYQRYVSEITKICITDPTVLVFCMCGILYIITVLAISQIKKCKDENLIIFQLNCLGFDKNYIYYVYIVEWSVEVGVSCISALICSILSMKFLTLILKNIFSYENFISPDFYYPGAYVIIFILITYIISILTIITISIGEINRSILKRKKNRKSEPYKCPITVSTENDYNKKSKLYYVHSNRLLTLSIMIVLLLPLLILTLSNFFCANYIGYPNADLCIEAYPIPLPVIDIIENNTNVEVLNKRIFSNGDITQLNIRISEDAEYQNIQRLTDMYPIHIINYIDERREAMPSIIIARCFWLYQSICILILSSAYIQIIFEMNNDEKNNERRLLISFGYPSHNIIKEIKKEGFKLLIITFMITILLNTGAIIILAMSFDMLPLLASLTMEISMTYLLTCAFVCGMVYRKILQICRKVNYVK